MKKLGSLKSSSWSMNGNINGGLLNRLVTCLSLVNTFGQTRAVAQTWKEFVLELRYRYDSNIFIPDVYTTTNNTSTNEISNNLLLLAHAPDLSRCLLHQKIQMLNCCIKKRVERQAYETKQQTLNDDDDENEDEEQFFDCDDDVTTTDTQFGTSRSTTQSIKNFVPEGRLKKFDNLALLNKPSESIYVPLTQESTPMTEDMLEQHASVLVNLGSSDDAALLRAKIQSASLLSDMQSFKVFINKLQSFLSRKNPILVKGPLFLKLEK
jgi:Rab3 GTPase-activating protein catalytic subunit